MAKIKVRNIPIIVETPDSSMSEFIGLDFPNNKVYIKFRSSPDKVYVYTLPKWAGYHFKRIYKKRIGDKRDYTHQSLLTHYVANFVLKMGFDYYSGSYV